MQPLIIEAAQNELMEKADNPHVPYGPEEVAADAAACVAAGAAMLHFHARDASTGEQLWTGTQTYVEALRRSFALGVPRDVVFYPTYEWLTDAQLAHVFALRRDPEVRLRLAALDVGAVLLNRFEPATRSFERADWGKVFTHAQTIHFLERCRAEGLRVYSGCAEPGHLRHLLAYRELGLLDAPLVLKFFTARDAPYGLQLLDELMGELPRVWFVHCYGPEILPMAAEAILLGGHVRIGLGDETFSDTKPTNAELVARVAELARAIGRPLATPREAREMLGLPAWDDAA
jgi:3-keto-5-aminohexanoate cleavage enzyme